MNTEELNEYLTNYLKNDKTGKAVLLTAPWGSGKSYYIKNKLCPYLQKYNLTYAIVSLYGLRRIKELNKSLYLELRTPKVIKNMHKESKSHIKIWIKKIFKWIADMFNMSVNISKKIWGKTILKGIAGMFNMSLNISEKDLEKLYKSINLQDKLIIFEDVERSGIDLIDFLGYVNNLVETDGIKVLLVANEDELQRNQKSEQYDCVKEKTIGDTIKFIGNAEEIIQTMLHNFNKKNKYLKDLLNEDMVYEIKKIMLENKCNNYRLLLFALQKIEDVFIKFESNKRYDQKFLKTIITDTIDYITSDSDKTNEKTLYNFMHQYIYHQKLSLKDIDSEEQIFLEQQNCLKVNEALEVIYHYYCESEKNVRDAIENIQAKLQQDKITYTQYIQLAKYLIAISSILEKDRIDDCLKIMLYNLKNSKHKIKISSHILGLGLENKEEKKFQEFQEEIEKISGRQLLPFDFNYTPQEIPKFSSSVKEIQDKYDCQYCLASKLDINKFLELLKICNAKEIDMLRGAFIDFYRGISDVRNVYFYDKENLVRLKQGVEEMSESQDNGLDNIQRLQLKWYALNLQDILQELEENKKRE